MVHPFSDDLQVPCERNRVGASSSHQIPGFHVCPYVPYQYLLNPHSWRGSPTHVALQRFGKIWSRKWAGRRSHQWSLAKRGVNVSHDLFHDMSESAGSPVSEARLPGKCDAMLGMVDIFWKPKTDDPKMKGRTINLIVGPFGTQGIQHK